MWLWIKTKLPTPKNIQKKTGWTWLGKWLRDRPYLWTFTKHSVSGAIAVSIFIAFLPLPLEMLVAALLSILFRVNIAIPILSTWFTNIFTLVPANYFSYKVGEYILNYKQAWEPSLAPPHFSWTNILQSLDQYTSWLGSLGKAYIIGLPVLSISISLIAYLLVYLSWSLVELVHHALKSKKKS